VSPRFVNNMMTLHRVDGSLEAKSQGRPCGSGKLADDHAWIRQRLPENGDLTLDQLCIELAGRGASSHRSSGSPSPANRQQICAAEFYCAADGADGGTRTRTS
jgi:hypothetical protein